MVIFSGPTWNESSLRMGGTEAKRMREVAVPPGSSGPVSATVDKIASLTFLLLGQLSDESFCKCNVVHATIIWWMHFTNVLIDSYGSGLRRRKFSK